MATLFLICSALRQKKSVEPTSCMSSRKVLPISSKASAILLDPV